MNIEYLICPFCGTKTFENICPRCNLIIRIEVEVEKKSFEYKLPKSRHRTQTKKSLSSSRRDEILKMRENYRHLFPEDTMPFSDLDDV